MPERPFKSAEKVFLVTPRALAASVTLILSGSTQNSFMISPGCGGLYIVIFPSLMIIFIIYIKGVSVLNLERNAPVLTDFNRPNSLWGAMNTILLLLLYGGLSSGSSTSNTTRSTGPCVFHAALPHGIGCIDCGNGRWLWIYLRRWTVGGLSLGYLRIKHSNHHDVFIIQQQKVLNARVLQNKS